MPRAKLNKLYRTFVRGLITEAGFLTYPEDSSTDELNTVLSRKGNRTRRLGIDYEDNHQLVDVDAVEGEATVEFVWKAADKVSTNNFVCIQVGAVVHFFSLEAAPVSDSHKSFTIDLTDYKSPTATVDSIQSNCVAFASGKGFLFIVHPYVEPLCVEYDTAEDSFTVIPVVIQVRDFEGMYDGLANDEEPTTLSKEHHYNLLNQGWVPPGSKTAPVTGGTGSTDFDGGYYDPYSGTFREYTRAGEEKKCTTAPT